MRHPAYPDNPINVTGILPEWPAVDIADAVLERINERYPSLGLDESLELADLLFHKIIAS